MLKNVDKSEELKPTHLSKEQKGYLNKVYQVPLELVFKFGLFTQDIINNIMFKNIQEIWSCITLKYCVEFAYHMY